MILIFGIILGGFWNDGSSNDRRAGKTEWAHALAGGWSVWGADPSTGSGREDVPGTGDIVLKKTNNNKECN